MNSKNTINKHHKRGIRTTLAMLDEMLCEFEQMIENSHCNGIIFSQNCEMNKNSIDSLKEEIEIIKQKLIFLKDKLNIEKNLIFFI